MSNCESSRVFICGAVRNCEKLLDVAFNDIKKITELFADFHIIMAFDESTDNTLFILNQYKQDFRDKMDILVNTNPLSVHRTENISNARNAYLHKMRDIVKSGFVADYFIVMDMDNMNLANNCRGSMNIDVLKRAMNKSDKWECVSFNKHGYYDIWALSIDSYIYSYQGWETTWIVAETMRTYIIDKLSKIPADELVECRSAFNGFAVYKTRFFLDCHYDWRTPKQYMTLEDLKENQRILGYMPSTSPLDVQTDEPDCEHRAFHMMATAKHGARIRITPECLF
jgi:glycosyltransferase involved in cell wall biosynthesis